MGRRALASVLAVAAVMAVLWLTQTRVAAQAPAVSASRSAAPKWTPPRTPWGDPDVQGFFTNNDESGIPLERPNQFERKQLGDVSDTELAELNRQRRQQDAERAPFLGGLPIGSNSVHWFENTEAKNSRAWLLVDPADGRVPLTTPEAQRRPAPRGGSSFGNGPFNGPEDLSLYDRCITTRGEHRPD